jgi:DNA-directed RNA polymerase subunit beta'
LPAGTLIEERDVEKIEKANVQSMRIRSVLTCETRNGVCGKCYGRDLARGTPVNMGEAVGVIAAQSIGEPGTQLTMRTFHIGGTAQVVDQSTLESNFEGAVRFRNRNIVRDGEGRLVAMGRNMQIVILDADGQERAVNRITYGSRLHVDDGDMVKRGQRLAEWDPYTRPVLTEVDGIIGFEDLVDRVSVTESADESTGITKRVVVDWRANPRGGDLKPAIVIKGKDGKIKKTARGTDARYLLPVDAILSVDGGGEINAGDVLARIPLESAKTRDITGGLPRVAELFEARRPKDHAIIAEIDGTIRFGRDYKNKRRIILEPMEEGAEAIEYLIPKGKPFHLQDGDTVEKGDFIVEGNPAPHDILAIKGIEALAAYLVNEIQDVYRLQGVTINDKHIEVIVRQMLQKVEITDQGDTDMFPGEQIDQLDLDIVNEQMVAERKKPASGRSGAPRHHQGEPADPLLLLGGVLPGDHPRPHRGGRPRQGRTRSRASRRTSSSAG